MAALLCASLPLALGLGDGAELRQPLGISIVGGLIVSQMLTLYTNACLVYLYLDSFRLWGHSGWCGNHSSSALRVTDSRIGWFCSHWAVSAFHRNGNAIYRSDWFH